MSLASIQTVDLMFAGQPVSICSMVLSLSHVVQ